MKEPQHVCVKCGYIPPNLVSLMLVIQFPSHKKYNIQDNDTKYTELQHVFFRGASD